MAFNKISADFKANGKSNGAGLHKALEKLDLIVVDGEKNPRKIAAATTAAVKEFQKTNKLKPTGRLNEETVLAMNVALHDNFVTVNKNRTEKLHTLLQKINLKIDKEEISTRAAGASTRKAIKEFQKKNGMTVDGKLSEEVLDKLHEAVIKERLKANTQKGFLQTKLQKASKIAGLNLEITPDELKSKQLGATSTKIIEEFQKKYNLPPTGTVDRATLHRLESVAASRGTFVKKIGKPEATELSIVNQTLRINKTSPAVNNAQKALSFLGFNISKTEFNTKTFGKTTRQAVLAFQKNNGLAQTGQLEKADIKALNAIVLEANPAAEFTVSSLKYRIRGSVRDELWQRQSNMVIKVFEKLLDGESALPLASKRNFPNGFFDIIYTPPINAVTGQVKDKFHLVVKLFEPVDNNPANDKSISSQTHYNVNKIHWVNFTTGDVPYAGKPDFAIIDKIVKKTLGAKDIKDLHEKENDKQISQMAVQTGLSTDDIMRLLLSYLVADNINQLNPLSPEIFYAFIRQNLPPNLPGDLLRGTSEWETIDQLIELAASGIVFTNDEIQQQTIDNALAQNLVSQMVKVNRNVILQELKNKRNSFTLEKPILTGNQNLKTIDIIGNKIIPQH